MSSLGFTNHRDYAAYAMHIDSINGNQGIGAGWLSYKANSSTPVVNYDLVYAKPNGSGPTHNLTNVLSSGTQPTLRVTQNAQSSSCWRGLVTTSSTTNSYTHCFASGSFSLGSVAGVTGRTFSAYSAGSNTMPGQFDRNYYYYWSNGVLTFDSTSYFSTVDLNKCYSTKAATGSGWIVDFLTKYSSDPNGLQIDKVAVGPSVVITDDCTSGLLSQSWELPGE